ncbi:MAG: hypothetical protein QOK50_07350 [Nitrososphaeraceae archaeon]|nr:hypothetical protein [Nitrososphaeraceae archaeon]
MGVWRILGYVYAGLNILGGFILIGAGASMSTQPSLGTGFSGMLNQIGSFAFIYSGLAGIMVGILLIWALVKSGQIENIDKNIQIIAEWAKSQMQKEGLITKELPKDDKFESAK